MPRTTEVWKKVASYPRYEVSNLGRVRSSYKNGRILRPVVVLGYLKVTIYHPQKLVFVHRLIAAAFLGPCKPGKQVHHKNGNKHDNRVSNLCYVTPKENIEHAHRTGLATPVQGIRHGRVKLSESQVLEIRKRKGQTTIAIAKEFGIAHSQVSRIRTRSRWKHLQ